MTAPGKVDVKIVPAIAALLASATHAVAAPAISDRSLARPEGERHYIVAEPAGLVPARRPLVILLHGHGASAAQMVGLSSFAGYQTQDWMRLAEREQVLLIAPDGLKASDGKSAWNDCRGDAPTNTATDDVGFISALIDTAVTQLHADPERVYVFGSSNGGGMAYRLGIELGGRLAAIGVQSSLMPARSRCKAPSHPLSVFVLHGTADTIAPYAGGKVGNWLVKGRGTGISAEASVAVWRTLAGLPEQPVVVQFPRLRAGDPTSATRFVWGSDPRGIQVEFLRIDGGGHVHTSKDEELPWLLGKILGKMNHDVDTASEAWSFFKDKRAVAVTP
jgi:polyhydroxybutyrate depolymerase